MKTREDGGRLRTEILTVAAAVVCKADVRFDEQQDLDAKGRVTIDGNHVDARHLRRAAEELKSSDIPVAFPTETVYGLGADATRSAAVQGIYRAKQRPSDNPLIVHVHSVRQLRELLQPESRTNGVSKGSASEHVRGPVQQNGLTDPIPSIYTPLIQRFWPGPLTMIMPNPEGSLLAPEVTAGLSTFGVRMPDCAIALALIQLAGVPLAAPSANASTKPSPTTAAHVKHDLDGRIATIVDGGACQVGVESTVVDGLSDPPAILRPGGVSLEDLRACRGWGKVTIGYRDAAQTETRPRAPGMKYKHYSPKAPVVLHEWTASPPNPAALVAKLGPRRSVGVIRTREWPEALALHSSRCEQVPLGSEGGSCATRFTVRLPHEDDEVEMWDVELGRSPESIARGLFSALRELDLRQVEVIFVEGIDDGQGDVAAAVMNRLRKSAEQQVDNL